MPRTFYTERDIEDLFKRGVTELQVDDSVYITDVGREMMDRLGMKRRVNNGTAASSSVLKSPDVANLHSPAPTANAPVPAPVPAPTPAKTALTDAEKQQVIDQVKSGVIARLGAGVDTAVVDKIVRRVVGQL